MPKKVIGFIPNLITLCNLLSGCIAVYMAFHQGEQFGSLSGLQWTWIAIAAAAVFDFGDGASARGLKAYSPIGAELDSLSDLVSFGVAPGMMILNLMLGYSDHTWLCFASLLIPAFGAYRLAKFNVDDSQTTSFRGLPIPANAIFWIGTLGWINVHGYPGDIIMTVLIIALSLLMVSELKMFSLKFANLSPRDNVRRYVVLLAAILFVITDGLAGLAWTIVLYILISLLGKKTDPQSAS